MNTLIVIGLLFYIFGTGTCIICDFCKVITSDDGVIDPGETDNVSCSDNPGEMVCPDGISACMTGVIYVAYSLESGQHVTFRDKQRSCAPEEIVSSIPSGDHCVERSVVDAYFSTKNPTELYPDTENMTFEGILNATLCVCDSADKCNSPSHTVDLLQTGAESRAGTGEGDGSIGASGNLRTCIECREITSDVKITVPGFTDIDSCLDNPGEMVCREGVPTCYTSVFNIAYRLRSGQTVKYTAKQRACAFEYNDTFSPPGDLCVDQSVIDAELSAKPVRLPGMHPADYELLMVDATYCVCDSADKCTPPSPTNGAEAGANLLPVSTWPSLMYAFVCGFRNIR